MNKRGYDFISLAVIFGSLALLFWLRRDLPVFSDTWYHLAVVRAFAERGPTLQAWWEYAPLGRPHLYSPLFHLLNVPFAGAGYLNLARFWGVVTFPAVLLAGWLATRSLFGPRAALAAVLLMASNIALLFPCSLIIMPGTFAVMLWPFAHILILRGRWLLAGVLLAVIGYLHFGVATAALLSALVNWRAAAVGAGLFAPWLIHLFAHREFLHSGQADLPVFLPVFTLAAAIAGFVLWWKRRDKAATHVLLMIVASAIFLFTVRERFWTYGGFLLAILGGYGVERFSKWVVPVLLVSCLSVTPFLKPATMKLALPVPLRETPGVMGTPLLALAFWQTEELPEVPKDLRRMGNWIAKNVPREEVLMTEDRLLGSALFVLSGRATSAGLWSEVTTPAVREKLAWNYRHAGGYLVTTGEVPLGAEKVASFGRFTVFHRSGGVE